MPKAREIANGLGLVVVARDPDGPPLGALMWPGTWLVTAQDPAAGYSLPGGAPVVVEFEEEDGGEAVIVSLAGRRRSPGCGALN